jgi:iron complex transport system substrate-binding protein
MTLLPRLFLVFLLAAAASAMAETQTLTDMAGRTVTAPRNPSRVACVEVLCFEKFFLLGAQDRLVEMVRTDPPWMSTIDPAVARIAKVEATPNREDLLARGVDLVFLRYDQLQLDALARAGLPAVVSQRVLGMIAPSAEAFIDSEKQAVRLFGAVIGGDASVKAERWCADFDARFAYVMGRTRDIAQAKRPRIYYLRGPDALTTQGPGLNTYWYAKIAGGSVIAGDPNMKGPAPISMEEILRQDPEYIFVGRQYSPNLVLKDPHWKDVSAVKNGHVVSLPDGLFYWDGSTEGMLLSEFIAKTIHPDLFADLDLAHEVRGYYQTFYGFNFTEEQLSRFLAGQTPEGVRRGY